MDKNLVFIVNDRPVTDSLTVADVFGKRHDRVLQDLRDLGCSVEFRLHHFVESSYTNLQHRVMPKFLMTEQGFTLLVMGYTGQDAMRFKEAYIAEFD
ncbi:MAG: Rha family transcriptional regulator [Alicyclobacillaceae bacterium]|nr:Rha family transcriptional regulator [Alicyclobacillaceae bacterium]